MFKLNHRYVYKGMSAKLHAWYDGPWSLSIQEAFSENFQKLFELSVSKGNRPEYAKLDVAGWVKLADPSCYDHSEPYKRVQDCKKSKDFALVEQMTLPGFMTDIIEFAKKSDRKLPPAGKMSRWIGMFIYPNSEWYHSEFAKDLYKIQPGWCTYVLKEDEQKELLAYFRKVTGKMPTGRDPWIIPKHSILDKFKGSFLPLASSVTKKFADKDLMIAYYEEQLKANIKPKEWRWLEYNYPEYAQSLKEKYPKVTNKKEWLANNLTKPQQAQVDKWLKVEELVSTDEPDDKLLARLTSEERSLVGNYFKQLNASRSRKGDKKISEYVNPIIDRIKEKRPELYKHYTTKKVKTNTTHPFYDITGPGAKNEETMEQFYILAKNGADRPTNALASSLAKLAGKNTRYPEFAEEIRRLRPDWFDKKLLAKDRSDRFHKRGKYKETV
jgi:hypothetical protein